MATCFSFTSTITRSVSPYSELWFSVYPLPFKQAIGVPYISFALIFFPNKSTLWLLKCKNYTQTQHLYCAKTSKLSALLSNYLFTKNVHALRDLPFSGISYSFILYPPSSLLTCRSPLPCRVRRLNATGLGCHIIAGTVGDCLSPPPSRGKGLRLIDALGPLCPPEHYVWIVGSCCVGLAK